MLTATRLKPLPFLEPERLIALIEQDPSLVEEGLRVAAREIPVPALAPEARIDLLAVDASRRANAFVIAPAAGPGLVERSLGLGRWLEENLVTLRALAPALSDCGGGVRVRILTGAVPAPTLAFLDHLGSSRPEVLQMEFFDSPAGLAVSVRPALPAEPPPEPARAPLPAAAPGLETGAAPGGDPLSGIPLTAEEAAEFRKLSGPTAPRRPRREPATSPGPSLAPPGTFVEN